MGGRKKKANNKRKKSWVCICPVCNLEVTTGSFSCVYCKPKPQWVHNKCGGYKASEVKVAPSSSLRCNNCKEPKHGLPTLEVLPQNVAIKPTATKKCSDIDVLDEEPQQLSLPPASPVFLPYVDCSSKTSTPRLADMKSTSNSTADDSIMYDDDDQDASIQLPELHEVGTTDRSDENSTTVVSRFTPLGSCVAGNSASEEHHKSSMLDRMSITAELNNATEDSDSMREELVSAQEECELNFDKHNSATILEQSSNADLNMTMESYADDITESDEDGGPSQEDGEEEEMLLLFKGSPVIRGILVEGNVVHGQPIIEGNVKVLICDVLNTWEGYDPDYHTTGTFLQWPRKYLQRMDVDTHAKQLSSFLEGEGIMTGHAETYLELGLKRGRKRKRDPSTWKVTRKRKEANSGARKEMKGSCRQKEEKVMSKDGVIVTLAPCRLKCSLRLSEVQRRKNYDHYWSLECPQRKWDFLNSNIQVTKKQRSRKRKESNCERQETIKRFIDGVEVCKTMFENTLGISSQVVKTVIRKRDENGAIENDQRGKSGCKPSHKKEVIKHIKLFPVKDTHYCRSGTERRWLHEDLSLRKMYELYLRWCKEQSLSPCKMKYYRQIFNTEFNLSFHVRKKDKCQLCEDFDHTVVSKDKKRNIFRESERWKELDYNDLMKIDFNIDDSSEEESGEYEDESEAEDSEDNKGKRSKQDRGKNSPEDLQSKLSEKYRFHRREVELSRKLKLKSKTNSAHSLGKRVTAHCDLQQVMDCPKTNVGEVFYKRLLSVYNFVIVDITSDDSDCPEGHCYIWDETNGNRGTNEIDTCLVKFCKSVANKGVRHIDFFFDGCGGQGRNTLTAATCHHIVHNTDIVEITVSYLVKGHTENDADTVHSIIERDKKSKKVFLPSEWATVIHNTPTIEYKLTTHEMSYRDFFDTKELKDEYKNFRMNRNGEVILNWMKISVFRVTKGSNILKFKRWFSENTFQEVDMMQIGKGRRSSNKIYQGHTLVNAYDEQLPISGAKFGDLMTLCDGEKPVIPRRYHSFYLDLKHD